MLIVGSARTRAEVGLDVLNTVWTSASPVAATAAIQFY